MGNLSAVPPSKSSRKENRVKGPHLWEIQAVRDIFLMLAVAGTITILYVLRGIFVPLVVAFGLAYLVNPLITSVEKRWHVPRSVSLTVVVGVFTVSTAAFIAWLGPLLAQQAQTLATKAPAYIKMFGDRYNIELSSMSEQVRSWTLGFQEDPLAAIQPIYTGTSQAVGFIGTVIGTTSYIAMTTILMLIYFFMFAWSFSRMAASIEWLIPVGRRARFQHVLGKIDDAVFGFFRGRLLVALITGVLYSAGWALTDVPYWFLLGAGTGLLTIIPYISVIGWPLAILLKYVDTIGSGQGAGWVSIIVLPSLPYLVVQFLESWWLTPWIQGRTNELSAVTVIVVVLVGGAVAGLLGMLVAIPLVSIAKILFHEFVLPKWHTGLDSK